MKYKYKNMREFVNEFDKTFDIKLNRKKYKDVIGKEIDNQIDIFESTTKRLICNINKVSDDYLLKDMENDTSERMFIPKDSKRVETSTFEELSNLKWLDEGISFPIKSATFRKRFETLLLISIVRNIEFIAYNMLDQPHSEDEFTLVTLSQMTSDIEKIITSPNSHETKLMLIKWCHYIDSCKHKTISKFNDTIDEIRLLVSTPLTTRKTNHDMMLFYISKLAFMLATDRKPKSIRYDLIDGYRLGDDATQFLKYMGEKINEKDRSLVFEAFIVSSPQMQTEIDDPDIMIARTALSFVEFILSDIRWVKRFISKI